jgi:hypothetical protein
MITVNMGKARAIGHKLRRNMRAEEFGPLDELISKQIPGVDAIAVEEQRQAVREKYAAIQSEIEAAQTPEEIKAALGLGAA